MEAELIYQYDMQLVRETLTLTWRADYELKR